MNILKSILFLIIVIPIELLAQDSFSSEIFELFPDCTNLDTKLYLTKNDTCFDLVELESVNLPIGLMDELVIENSGKMPIVTSLEKILNGQTKTCESVFHPIPKYEISPRRINKLRKETKYYCVENNVREIENEISKLLFGLYKNCNEILYKIEEQKIIEFYNSENGFRINNYLYSIERDKISCTIEASFIWNEIDEKLIKIDDKAQIHNLEIETCYLLNDCRQNHITTTIAMGCWQKQIEDKRIENVIKKIKNY